MSNNEKTPLLVIAEVSNGHSNHYGDATDGSDSKWEDLEHSTTSLGSGTAAVLLTMDASVRSTTSRISVDTFNTSNTGLSRFSYRIRQFSTRFARYVVHHTGSIGMLGSISIAVNSLTGPAMLSLPATFARSGVIPTVSTLVFVCILSALCSLHMANSISKVPGNATFKKEVEFSEVFRIFGGRRWFYTTQLLFLCCITCLNISSIVDTVEVVDTVVGIWWPGGTAALHIRPPQSLGYNHYTNVILNAPEQRQRNLRDDIDLEIRPNHVENVRLKSNGDNEDLSFFVNWVRWDYSACTKEDIKNGHCLPFVEQSDGILFTVGNLITTLTFLPMALLDLKENSWWQVVGFIILLFTSVLFVVQFASSGLEPSYLTWWGTDWDDLLGVVLFNFSLVIAIPAWLYEREPHVDVPTVIHSSSGLVVVLYIAIGLLGAMALPNVSDNMLESMILGAEGLSMQLGASLFAVAIVGLGIPLFSVVTRLNLTEGLCTTSTANILSVYFPFAVSWILNDGQAVTKLLSWGGVVFTSLVAFVLPLGLALRVTQVCDAEGTIAVYGRWLKDKASHATSLRLLLLMALFAIAMAIAGNFVGSDDN